MPIPSHGLGLLALLPAGWLSGEEASSVTGVEAGMGQAEVFRIGASACYLKIAAHEAAESMRREIARTRWLGARGVTVPQLLRTLQTADFVAMLTAELPGVLPGMLSDGAPSGHARPIHATVEIIARAFAALHALPMDDCPFDESVEVRLARARRAIARGEIDPAHFAERNSGRTAQQILAWLVAHRPTDTDPVVVHGDATFDNMRIDDDGRLGLLDCGHAGRGDRYVDLERITAEIDEHFGAQWIEPFWRSYGLKIWDQERADFFAELYELF
jgi:aminoglycoside 3'-phosphotransferase-2